MLPDLLLAWWEPLFLLTALPAALSDWQDRTVAARPAWAWGTGGLLLGGLAWGAGNPAPALQMAVLIPFLGWACRRGHAGPGDLLYGLPVLLEPLAWPLAGVLGLTLRRRTGSPLPFVSLLWLGLFMLHLARPALEAARTGP